MIRFSLRCTSDHEFEGWFRSGDSFEAQQQAGEIACPECGDTHIEKALMAPAIGRGKSATQLSPAQMKAVVSQRRRAGGRTAAADGRGPGERDARL